MQWSGLMAGISIQGSNKSGNFRLPQNTVTPANAGIQLVLISMRYEGLGPSLRWYDGFLV